MSNSERPPRASEPSPVSPPTLDEGTRARLGEQLKQLYDPVIEEQLDPHLIELLQLLAAER